MPFRALESAPVTAPTKRIGLFGGTFDPLHIGHLVAATWAREACDLDEVLVMVANEPWQKTGEREISPASLRFEAVRNATKDVPGLRASDLEIRMGGETSTLATVSRLLADDPDTSVVLIVGTDAARGLGSWRGWQELAEAVELAVVSRAGEPQWLPAAPWTATRVDIPDIEISSTQLRERIKNRASVDFLVPREALDVYLHAGLYS